MKSFAKYFGVVAGMAALIVSCNKPEKITMPETDTVEMTIIAGSDETKTVLGADGAVTWSTTGEKLAVIEQSYVGETPSVAKATSKDGVTSDEGATMSFGVELKAKEADSFNYYALYPNSAYVSSSNTDVEKFKVALTSTQTPTATSFGPEADILVYKAVIGETAQPTELKLQFARVIAVGKMTIKDLNTTENVKKVTFTAAGKPVTGRSYINLTTAAGVEYGYSDQGVDNVVLDYSGKTITANGMAAYFTCWPFELGAGDTFSVVVETENYTFTKNITLAEGKSLAFKVGRASAFNVSFSGIEGVEKATATATVTYTVTSTSAVSVSGAAPSGSSATYSSTYNSKCQLTKGSSMTLTLSGYKGMIVKGLTLSMKSNKSAGAGYLSVKAGTTTLSSIGSSNSGVNFNNASWHGDWSQSYVDVKPTLSNNAYTVKNGENIVIVIGATANSLYCESFTIEYVADPSFVDGPGSGEGGGETGGGETGGETPLDYTFATSTSQSNTAYATNYDVTISGIKWSVPGNQNFNGYVRIGGRNLSNTVRYIYSKTALPVGYKTITMSTNGINNSSLSVGSVVCKVYSSATGAANGGESDLIATMTNTDDDWAVSTAKTIVFTDESSATGSERYYRFEFTLTNTTDSNYGINLQKIVFSAN